MFWMFVILAIGAGAYFGRGTLHEKWLIGREAKAAKQLQAMAWEVELEMDAERRRPTEKEIEDAERELNEEFGWD